MDLRARSLFANSRAPLSRPVPSARPIGVIDDDASVRDAVQNLLRSAGYPCVVFPSADAFLRDEDPARFACLIADIQMPGMSGIELTCALLGSHPALRVILVTAHIDERARAQASACSPACLLLKPFNAADLLGCVERAVSA